VPRVVASVVSRDDVEAVREKVHDLPFAFVSPLTAQDRDDSHVGRLFRFGRNSAR